MGLGIHHPHLQKIGELKYVSFSDDMILHIEICVSCFLANKLQDVEFVAHEKDTVSKNVVCRCPKVDFYGMFANVFKLSVS